MANMHGARVYADGRLIGVVKEWRPCTRVYSVSLIDWWWA